MKKFRVTIIEKVNKTYEIEVEANDKYEAKEIAWDEMWEKTPEPSYEKTMDTDSWVDEV